MIDVHANPRPSPGALRTSHSRSSSLPTGVRGGGIQVENRPLTDLRVLLDLLAGSLGLLEHRQHALAGGFCGAEGPTLDQRLDRLLVDRPVIHTLAEVPQRAEGRPRVGGIQSFPRALDRLDRLVADALDGVQAEADVALDDRELVI